MISFHCSTASTQLIPTRSLSRCKICRRLAAANLLTINVLTFRERRSRIEP